MLKFKPESLNFERLRPLLIPGGIIVFIFISGLLLIRPKINETFLIRKQLKRGEEKLANLTAKTAALEGLDQVRLSSRLEVATQALPSDKNLPLLLSALKNLAAKNDIEILSLQVDPGEIATVSAKGRRTSLSFLSFKIMVGGQMNDLKEFLAQTAQITPLMVVRRVGIEVQGTGEDLQVELRVDSPFLLPPMGLGPVETPLAQITDQEESIYKELSGLNPFSIEKAPPSMPSGKKNPFAF